MTELRLSQVEANSAVWKKVSEYLEARLIAHRAKNETNLPADATAKLRGRIAEAKALLAIGDPEPAQAVEPGNE